MLPRLRILLTISLDRSISFPPLVSFLKGAPWCLPSSTHCVYSSETLKNWLFASPLSGSHGGHSLPPPPTPQLDCSRGWRQRTLLVSRLKHIGTYRPLWSHKWSTIWEKWRCWIPTVTLTCHSQCLTATIWDKLLPYAKLQSTQEVYWPWLCWWIRIAIPKAWAEELFTVIIWDACGKCRLLRWFHGAGCLLLEEGLLGEEKKIWAQLLTLLPQEPPRSLLQPMLVTIPPKSEVRDHVPWSLYF